MAVEVESLCVKFCLIWFDHSAKVQGSWRAHQSAIACVLLLNVALVPDVTSVASL